MFKNKENPKGIQYLRIQFLKVYWKFGMLLNYPKFFCLVS